MDQNTWIRVEDSIPYYYNFVTKQTTRRKPDVYAADEQKLRELRRKQRVIARERLNDEWSICVDNFGNWFWYNSINEKSLWDIEEQLVNKLLSEYVPSAPHFQQPIEEEAPKRHIPEDTWINVDYANKKPKIPDASDEENGEEHAAEDDGYDFDFDVDYQLEAALQEQPETKEEDVNKGPSEDEVNNFYSLLDELNVEPFTVYENLLMTLKRDHRYIALRPKTAKTLFEEYCARKAKEIKPISHEDAYKEMLQAEVRESMRWEIFQRKFKRDSRFRNMGSYEREKLFKQHIQKFSV